MNYPSSQNRVTCLLLHLLSLEIEIFPTFSQKEPNCLLRESMRLVWRFHLRNSTVRWGSFSCIGKVQDLDPFNNSKLIDRLGEKRTKNWFPPPFKLKKPVMPCLPSSGNFWLDFRDNSIIRNKKYLHYHFSKKNHYQ